jgi:xylulokinase
MKLVEGGAKSNLWRQIIADITGISTIYLGKSQGAPLGDVVMAGVGSGVFKRYEVVREWLSSEAENKTNPKASLIYDELFKKYLKLYPSLKELF